VIVETVRNFEALPVLKLDMKTILLFACVITLLTTTGCFSPGRGGHWGGRAQVDVARPVVAMASTELVVVLPAGTVGALDGILP
jgi:hypothetical protein